MHAGREIKSLDYGLFMVTPIGNSIVYEHVYKNCVVKFGDHEFLIDLIPLHLQDLDAILGMDWLSRHYATVDCFEKLVMFDFLRGFKFIFHGEKSYLPT